MTYTPAEKRAAIKRELKLRRSAYPRWVAAGKMTQKEADKQIAIFEAIAADYAERDLFAPCPVYTPKMDT